MPHRNVVLATRDFSATIGSDGAYENISDLSTDTLAMTTALGHRDLGSKAFECTNHLGNVLATVSDRKLAIPKYTYVGGGGSNYTSFGGGAFSYTPGTGDYDAIAGFFTADVTSYSDYYPFGMQMVGRNGSASDYRYGFQGKEFDAETSFSSFQLRFWEGRIEHWISTDPYRQHPSPYVGMANNPLNRFDPDGGLDIGKAVKWLSPWHKAHQRRKGGSRAQFHIGGWQPGNKPAGHYAIPRLRSRLSGAPSNGPRRFHENIDNNFPFVFNSLTRGYDPATETWTQKLTVASYFDRGSIFFELDSRFRDDGILKDSPVQVQIRAINSEGSDVIFSGTLKGDDWAKTLIPFGMSFSGW